MRAWSSAFFRKYWCPFSKPSGYKGHLRKRFIMGYQYPTVNDFKTYFERDFPYGTDISTSVTDIDISKAMNVSNINVCEDHFRNQGSFTLGYLNLSAHYLVTSLRASSQGKDGQYNWVEQSKGVGSVNTSYMIPDAIKNNPYLAMLTKTNYGAMYLQSILPELSGQMFVVAGSTRP